MENKLTFYNMGHIESNKKIFLNAIEVAYGITEDDMEKVNSGYKFLFDDEIGAYIEVRFYDDGTQLITEIMGDYAENVMSVYDEFANKFFND